MLRLRNIRCTNTTWTVAFMQLYPAARRAARALRHLPDRLRHAGRRRRALQSLRAAPPGVVLFVCHGNICRSPYAEVALRRAVGGGVRVLSAGFIGPGRPTPAHGRTVAAERGLDLGSHRSQLLSEELVGGSELVVVMDTGQAAAIRRQYGAGTRVLILGDLDPDPIDTRTVRDPYDQEAEVFAAVYDRIDRCIGELARALATGGRG
jgi:protein-tyrosine phosphatase